MSILEYNEIVERKFVVVDGEPFEVLSAHVFRMQQRKPQNAAKLKNLITGKVREVTFHQNEKAEEAEIDEKEVKYLYNSKGEYWFCDKNDPSKRYSLPESVTTEKIGFIKTNSILKLMSWQDKNIGLKFPITVDLVVKEAPPAVKGDTAKGGNKVITLETGITISAPLFVNQGDVVRVNTETGEYRERV